MQADPNDDPDADFFAGRFLVEIVNWDGSLHVGLSRPAIPQEARFQGGLLYTRGIDIEGRIIAPRAHKGKRISVWIFPFSPEVLFGPDHSQDVGQFIEYPEGGLDRDFGANLWIPENSLLTAISCLGSVWKYVHIWTTDKFGERSSITDFSFSRGLHRNLDEWVGS